ncbi:ATP-grasp domain-containing protein [Marinomonas sp. TI.3.20]|uniref:ATP-grasp domain-containing protein n=1 Tax=Marinomonas sp. TI.3.20 TaxID=3121296 RepID=UPI00311E5310
MKCLLTNPVTNDNLLARNLNKLGIECIAFIEMDKVSSALNGAENRERQFDKSLYSDFYFSLDELPSSDKHSFDAVIAGGEHGVQSAELISNFYGLPGNDPATTAWRRDKESMQNRLSDCGLPQIRSVGIGFKDNIKKVISAIPSGPYILKPVSAAGGQSFSYCPTLETLEKAISQLEWGEMNCTWSSNDKFLVQEYISGTEYAVDMVTRGNEIVVSAISRYIRLSDMDDWSFPQVKKFLIIEDPNSAQFAQLKELAVKCAKALGISHGAAHMEFLLSERGWHMIEVGARLHGHLVPDLFTSCYENDLLSSFFRCYFDPSTALQPGILRKYAIQSFVVSKQEGILNGFTSKELCWLEKCDSLIAKELLYHKGENFPLSIDSITTPAHGFFANSIKKDLLNDVLEFDRIMNNAFNGKNYTIDELSQWVALKEKL